MFVILVTVILGAAAGWIASLLLNRNGSQDWLGNIVIGVLGAGLARFLFNIIGGKAVTDFTILGFGDLVIAVIGAVVLLFIVRAIKGQR